MRELTIEINPKEGKFFRYPKEIQERWIIANAPTGSGKTTATMNLIERLLEEGKINRAFIAVPTRALAKEIYEKLVKKLGKENVSREDSDAKLEGLSAGSLSEIQKKKAVVSTFEMLERIIYNVPPEKLDKTLFVVDEFHEVTNPERSITLLGLITYITKLIRQGIGVKTVLSTATFPDLEYLARWAEQNGDVLIIKPNKVEDIEREIIIEEAKVLTRNYRIKLSNKVNVLIEIIRRLLKEGKTDIFPMYVYVKHKQMSEVIAKRLKEELGVETAFIHGSLDRITRNQILEEMRKKNPRYKIVVGTNAISVGVNLSFSSVALLSLEPGFVKPSEIRQTIGRAGRAEFGIEKAYIIAIVSNSEERKNFENALKGKYESIAIPKDPVGLLLRLLSLNLTLEEWLKYSPLPELPHFEGPEVLEEALVFGSLFLKVIGAATEGNKLTRYGVILKDHLVDTKMAVVSHLIIQNKLKNDVKDAIVKVLTAIPLSASTPVSIISSIYEYVETTGFEGGYLNLNAKQSISEFLRCINGNCFAEALSSKGVKAVDFTDLMNFATAADAYWFPRGSLYSDGLMNDATMIEATMLTHAPNSDRLLVAAEKVATIVADVTGLWAYRRAAEIFRVARFAKYKLKNVELIARFIRFVIERNIRVDTYYALMRALKMFMGINQLKSS